MTTTPEPWLEGLVNEGVVDASGRTNAEARDLLMAAARTSLADATRDPERSPGGIICDTEHAVRQALAALAAHHGTRIVGQNKHAAVVRFRTGVLPGSRMHVPVVDSVRQRCTAVLRYEVEVDGVGADHHFVDGGAEHHPAAELLQLLSSLDQIAAERFFAADVGKWRAEFWVFGLVLRSLVELEEFSAARGASTGRNCSYANVLEQLHKFDVPTLVFWGRPRRLHCREQRRTHRRRAREEQSYASFPKPFILHGPTNPKGSRRCSSTELPADS
jgi:hypothetical protein